MLVVYGIAFELGLSLNIVSVVIGIAIIVGMLFLDSALPLANYIREKNRAKYLVIMLGFSFVIFGLIFIPLFHQPVDPLGQINYNECLNDSHQLPCITQGQETLMSGIVATVSIIICCLIGGLLVDDAGIETGVMVVAMNAIFYTALVMLLLGINLPAVSITINASTTLVLIGLALFVVGIIARFTHYNRGLH